MPDKIQDPSSREEKKGNLDAVSKSQTAALVASDKLLLNVTRDLIAATLKIRATEAVANKKVNSWARLKKRLKGFARGHTHPKMPFLFDREWYIERYPDVKASGEDPWLHYVKYGVVEGRYANAWFDTKWYVERYSDVAATGQSPLIHYIKYGVFEGRDPHPLFSTNWYLTRYPDVEKGGFNPLHHYLLHGASEGRLCHPRMNPNASAVEREEIAYAASIGPCQLFDSQWYLARYPDVRLGGIDPWSHYFWDGAREGRNPNPLFDTTWYCKRYPHVVALGVNPLIHFYEVGAALELDPHPAFITSYYQARYPDVAGSGLNPLHHFFAYGMNEGRLTFPEFDEEWYTSRYPEILDAGFKPFAHYLLYGRDEGRQAYEGDKASVARNSNIFVGYKPADSSPDAGHYFVSDVPQKYSYIAPRSPPDLAAIIECFGTRVKFSIVVPVFNTPEGLLEKLFESVAGQWYPSWELIFIDDCSTDANIRSRLNKFSNADERVVVLNAPQNGGIATSTNIGIEAITGEFVVFLDHDDELTADCLFELARCIDVQDPDFIYSDEDKIGEDGAFTQPFFKPDWSPDTFMNTMFTCHVSCVRSDLLRKLGGLRAKYDGCQDWDLILRVTENTSRIAHIPKVLYHWRIIPNSVAFSLAAKPYAIENSRLARIEALERRGFFGEVLPVAQLPGHFNVKYRLSGEPLISIVIPTRDNHEVLKSCIDSVLEITHYKNYEIIIVDNGSLNEDTLAYFKVIGESEKIRVFRYDIEFNYSVLNNFGVSEAKGDVIVFLNDDTEATQGDWLESLAAFAMLPHVGAVGAKLLYPNSASVQHNGILNLISGPSHAFMGMPSSFGGYFGRNLLDCNWLAVTGACLAVEKHKFLDVGGFDEGLPIAYNDVELCFRLFKAGYFNTSCSSIELIHHESVSRGVDHLVQEKRARLELERRSLYNLHPDLYMHDPFFNPNLHPDDPNFKLSNRWLGEN